MAQWRILDKPPTYEHDMRLKYKRLQGQGKNVDSRFGTVWKRFSFIEDGNTNTLKSQ